MRVSVVICTWNRAALLEQTLAQLAHLRMPAGVQWEVVVVNNNSTDATDATIERHRARLPLRRLFESRSGKSFAANLAIAQTESELLLWTDDDVLVDPDWLKEYVAAARAWPDATFFGGTIEPLFAVPPARWISRNVDLLTAPYAIQQYGPGVRPLGDREIPFGANMGMRRQVLHGEAFNQRLGPFGTFVLRGEESELIHRLKSQGHWGVWVGTARVKHYIPAGRLTQDYLWKSYVALGRTEARVQGMRRGTVPRWAVRRYVTARTVMGLLAPFKGRRWLWALRAAAKAWGVIQECREMSREAAQEVATGVPVGAACDS
jgi:glycosyltransferase involved in cell wall biosynthesis